MVISRDTILLALSALGEREADLLRWLADIETYGSSKPEANALKARVLGSIERTRRASEDLLALYPMTSGEGAA